MGGSRDGGNRDRGPWGADCPRCGEHYTFTNRSIRHIRADDGRHLVSDQHDVGCRRRHGETVRVIRNSGRGDTITLLPIGQAR